MTSTTPTPLTVTSATTEQYRDSGRTYRAINIDPTDARARYEYLGGTRVRIASISIHADGRVDVNAIVQTKRNVDTKRASRFITESPDFFARFADRYPGLADAIAATIAASEPQPEPEPQPTRPRITPAQAEQLGRAAHAAGRPAAPALDAAVMDALDGVPVGGGSLPILQAWTNGWHAPADSARFVAALARPRPPVHTLATA